MTRCSALALTLVTVAAAQDLRIARTPEGAIEIRRGGAAHPLSAPDGNNALTQFRPSHHQRQTGIYFGFANVNGRSLFHDTDGAFFRGQGARVDNAAGRRVSWSVVTDWLAEGGVALFTETPRWTMEDSGAYYTLDLD